MGDVFEAEDLRLGRTMALKSIAQRYLGKPDALRRFAGEARLAAAVNHARAGPGRTFREGAVQKRPSARGHRSHAPGRQSGRYRMVGPALCVLAEREGRRRTAIVRR